MKHRPRQLDMAEMSRTFRHSFTTSLAFLRPLNSPKSRIEKSANLDARLGLIHRIRILDLKDTHRLAKKGQLPETQRMLPSGNNRGKYISSGPKIPNCTYITVLATKFKRMKVDGDIPPLHAEGARKTARLLRTGLPLCEFDE
jgi:hypothetical protein